MYLQVGNIESAYFQHKNGRSNLRYQHNYFNSIQWQLYGNIYPRSVSRICFWNCVVLETVFHTRNCNLKSKARVSRSLIGTVGKNPFLFLPERTQESIRSKHKNLCLCFKSRVEARDHTKRENFTQVSQKAIFFIVS